MTRRNLLWLIVIATVSLLCYRKADSEHRTRYGRMFGTFTEVLEQIERKYVEEVDERELFEGALDGLISKLDPYSAYYAPLAAAESRASLNQEFGGIGIEVTIDRETKILTILSPLPGTPADAAGIRPGDKILKINDESTEGFTMEDTVKRLRGKAGEPVRLEILHEGEEKPVELKIVRAVISVDSVLGDRRRPDGTWDFTLEGHPGIGYVRVTTFGIKTADELYDALTELKAQGMKGLVLDLRGNTGGLLEEGAVRVSNLFIKEGRIVSTRGRDRKELVVKEATGKAPFTDFPMVVLVNRFSASASEVVAACLQDHGRAKIVGERTFGKGSVQTVIEIEGGKSELRLTTASYWRPSGRNIHRAKNATEKDEWGVTPDKGFAVKPTDEQLLAMLRRRRARDAINVKSASAAEGKPVPKASDDKKPASDKEADNKDTDKKDDTPAAEEKPFDSSDITIDPQLSKAVEYLEGRIGK